MAGQRANVVFNRVVLHTIGFDIVNKVPQHALTPQQSLSHLNSC